ncbi:MAG TPA: hypothetical protein VN281_21035 [Verrucomicrobiae bacterium]|nr:hypothetical protein [Verrucomicrobiae bacterium]
MEIKNRQTMLLIVAGAGLLLLVADSAIITPLTKSWNARSKRIADLRTSIDAERQLIGRADQINGQWDQFRTNTLPTDVSQAENDMLKAINRWARDSGVNSVQIRPQWQEKSGEDYTTYECHADYTGDIRSISRFLYELEKDSISCKLENIEIASRDDNGRQLSLGIQLSGLVLSNPDQQ